jgi:tetratricopeptide (TPR) repeat protein
MSPTSAVLASSFAASLTRLHREVRLGNFGDSKILADRCLKHRDLASSPELLQLRACTLAWEVYDSLGDYGRAHSSLDQSTAIAAAIQKIESVLKRPSQFSRQEFPPELQAVERLDRYQLWRQRAVAMLADGFSAYRAHLLERAERRLNEAGEFIYDCLVPAGFACNGTKASLHFFTGLLWQRRRLLTRAAEDLDKSFEFTLARLSERIPANPENSELEKSFAHYCLGKLHVHMGELQFEQGRLASARRHLLAGKTLVITTQDTFIAHRAELLLCRIARSDEQFAKEGWALLDSFAKCRSGLQLHPAYHLEASIEEIKTAVYLHHAGSAVPGTPPQTRLRTIHDALTEIDPLIARARELNLRQSEFHAFLVKARILTRLGQSQEARSAIDRASGLYPQSEPPAPLLAEARFVLAKTYSSQKNFNTAARFFREALEIGHDSQTFQLSCHLQVLEMLIRARKFAEAREYLGACEGLLRQVESKFLRDRYDDLQKLLDSSRTITFKFGPNFELDAATGKLERFYVRNLAALIDRQPHDILKPGYWRLLCRKHGVQEDKRRIARLLSQHFSHPEAPESAE